MKSFKNKIVIITGAASGIGRQLSIQLANKGAKIILLDIDEKALKETHELINSNNGTSETYIIDVSKKNQLHMFADNIVEKYGHVDILINNAGVALGLINFEDLTYEEMEWQVNINLWGVIYGTKAFLPHIKNRPEASIVNISSVFGLAGIPGQSPYCISKFGIRGFTEALQAEYIDRKNLHIMLVHPGGVKTNIAKNARHRNNFSDENEKIAFDNRFEKNARTTAESAARQIINGITKKRPRLRIGMDAVWMDRIVRIMPQRAIALFAKMTKRFDEGGDFFKL